MKTDGRRLHSNCVETALELHWNRSEASCNQFQVEILRPIESIRQFRSEINRTGALKLP